MARDTVSTHIPRKWTERLTSEQEVLGCANRIECLDHILGSYFNNEKGGTADMSTPAEEQHPAPASDGNLAQLARQLGEATARLAGLEKEANRWKSEAETTAAELAAWQAMEKHAPVPHILEHLSTCANCKPQMEEFLGRHVAALPPDKVKELARQQKWWPPPPLELGISRKARS